MSKHINFEKCFIQISSVMMYCIAVGGRIFWGYKILIFPKPIQICPKSLLGGAALSTAPMACMLVNWLYYLK